MAKSELWHYCIKATKCAMKRDTLLCFTYLYWPEVVMAWACFQIVTLCFGISAVKCSKERDSPWIAANAGVAERPPESPGAAAGVGVDAFAPVSAGGGALVGGLGGGGSHVLGGGLDEGEGAAWFFGLGYSRVRRFGYWRLPFDWKGNDHWEKSMSWNSHLKDGKPFFLN